VLIQARKLTYFLCNERLTHPHTGVILYTVKQ
jgi:hypothetical protein